VAHTHSSQEDLEFEASLSYIARSYLKKKKKKSKQIPKLFTSGIYQVYPVIHVFVILLASVMESLWAELQKFHICHSLPPDFVRSRPLQ
jgi:hypothetical protein